MRKRSKLMIFTTALALSLSLTACGESSYPSSTLDGQDWNQNWTILGHYFGVEEMDNGLTLLENPVILTGSDTHYATWSYGESSTYINEDGDETDLYPAEVYMLAYGVEDGDPADTINEWMEREREVYAIESTKSLTSNAMDYQVMVYTVTSETNPYSTGAIAFASYQNYAVTIEVSCTGDYDGDAYELLSSFLESCHYGVD